MNSYQKRTQINFASWEENTDNLVYDKATFNNIQYLQNQLILI